MDRQYVGIDFHRRRSVIVRFNAAGERLGVTRVANDPFEFADALREAGESPAVVIEATYGWYWVVDLLQELGATVCLANPKALNWGDRRVKNDVVDAHDLADMLRIRRLAQAWIAPPAIRQLRELVRYRAKLVQLRSGLKAQVHAVMAKQGVLPRTDDMFGPGGNRQLDQMELDRNYAIRVQSLRDLIRGYDREIRRRSQGIIASCLSIELDRSGGVYGRAAVGVGAVAHRGVVGAGLDDAVDRERGRARARRGGETSAVDASAAGAGVGEIGVAVVVGRTGGDLTWVGGG